MALTQYTADTDIIETLGTKPEDRPTLTDNSFKAKFDENAANIAAFLNAMITELASVSAAKGASCIGLQDSDGRFTATQVEAALAEIAGSGRTTETVKGLADLISNLAGAGRTTETVKGLADLISTKPTMTTANLTYYVRKDGNDSNTGLENTSGGAFLTIGKAISMIPQIVNHQVVINVASGTYAETVVLSGFLGNIGISINGGTDITTAENFIINNLTINQCLCGVAIRGFNAKSTSGISFYVYGSTNVLLQYCTSISAFAGAGIFATTSFVKAFNCLFSNKLYAIFSKEGAVVYSANQYAGVSNTVALYAEGVATIGKLGTQPQGTTAEQVVAGGVIR